MGNNKLYINGRIYPLNTEGEIFNSMLVGEGRIQKLFKTRNEAENHSGGYKTIDLEGKTVLPGLIDCHSHFIATGAITNFSITVSEIINGRLSPDNLEGVARRLKSETTGKNTRKPILCVNYIIPSIKENRLPTSAELDLWLPGCSVIILSMDGHSSSYSTRALREIGLEGLTADGILSGEAHEFNMGKMNAYLMKSLSIQTLLSGITANVNDAIANGLTGIHCLEGFEDDPKDKTIGLLTRLAGGIPLKLRLFPQYMSLDRVKPLRAIMSKPRIGGCSSWEMDGSVSSHSAAFFSDYADAPGNKGKCYYSEDDILSKVRTADEMGYQITAHAIGPRGIELILSAFEKVLTENGEISNKPRHRIDHFEFPTEDQVKRAAALGIIITVQPGFSWMDENFQKSYHRYLSRDQYESQIPLKTFTALGGVICGGSDSPVQHQNPFMQIHGMVNFPLKTERLTVFEAFRTYTINAAYSSFEEDERGTLSEGKTADFIVLERDPFIIPTEELMNLKVAACFIDGIDRIEKPLGRARMVLRSFFGKRKKV